jgi:hypothetical protein
LGPHFANYDTATLREDGPADPGHPDYVGDDTNTRDLSLIGHKAPEKQQPAPMTPPLAAPASPSRPTRPPRRQASINAQALLAETPKRKKSTESSPKKAAGSPDTPDTPVEDIFDDDITLDDVQTTPLPDINDHPGGPLRVVRGTTRTNGAFKLHYVLPNLCTIGFGKIAHPDK